MFRSALPALLLLLVPAATCLADSTTVTASAVTNNVDGSGNPDGTSFVTFTVTVDEWNELFRDFHIMPTGDGAMWPPGSTFAPVPLVAIPGGDPEDSPVKDWTSGSSPQNSKFCTTGSLPGDAAKGVDSSQGEETVQFTLTCDGTAQSLADSLVHFEWRCTSDGGDCVVTGAGGNVHAGGASDDPATSTNPVPAVRAFTGPVEAEVDSVHCYTVNYGGAPPQGLTYTVLVKQSRLTGGASLGNRVNDLAFIEQSWNLGCSTNSIAGTTVLGEGEVRATYMTNQRNVFTLDIPDDASLVDTALHIQVRFSDGCEASAFTTTITGGGE
ncbi:MAG: hypothetical protein HY812_16405 [Planctomycetes bacterium]|nr:hypothetical protein [Planctomycetota bacterium]